MPNPTVQLRVLAATAAARATQGWGSANFTVTSAACFVTAELKEAKYKNELCSHLDSKKRKNGVLSLKNYISPDI